ncbi:MAG: hypothetical protein WC736_03730 [Gallionella sp.]|jgi:acetylornithine/succinyldiaminopimelate/putrescine aminotransferase
MKTKKTAKVEEPVVQIVAAKPLTKPAVKKVVEPVKIAKPAKEVKGGEVAAKVVVKAAKAAKEAKALKEPKLPKKPQVVRDSFTMPGNEYAKIAEIKEKGLILGLQVKKSEVLRAGLKALSAMDDVQLKAALSGLEKIKTGRPNKH